VRISNLVGPDVFTAGCPIKAKHPRVFVILIFNTLSFVGLYDVKCPSFYIVMPYGLVDAYRRFGGVYCLPGNAKPVFCGMSRKAPRGFMGLCFGNNDRFAH
jgi:hypothetical protein